MLKEKLTAGVVVKETYNKALFQDNLVEKIVNYIFKYDLNIFLGPEWLFLPEKRLYSKLEKDKIIEELAEKTKDRDTLIIPGSIMWYDKKYFYNTAPVISNGQLIGEYHKHNDGGSEYHAWNRNCKKPQYQKASNCVFSWKGYKVGVEICKDEGALRTTLYAMNKPFLDLYFLVSCGIELFYDCLPPKDFGYGLCSNGGQLVSEVLQKGDKGFKKIRPKKELSNMSIYELVMK